MNTSYNYADFLGMNIDSNIDHENKDEDSRHTQKSDKDSRVPPIHVNGSITEDKTTEQAELP